jgi:hypothetical protein
MLPTTAQLIAMLGCIAKGLGRKLSYMGQALMEIGMAS